MRRIRVVRTGRGGSVLRRRAGRLRVLGGAVLLLATGFAGAGPARADARVVLPASAAVVARADALVGPVPPATTVAIEVWLAPRLATDAERLAVAVSTPGNPDFHDYLSPEDYLSRFGPTPPQAAGVAAWLRGGGLADVHVGAGRDLVSASGTTAAVQSLFGVHLDRYAVDSGGGSTTVVQANDRPVSVPASLAPDILAVTGLSGDPSVDTAAPTSTAAPCSQYWGQRVDTVTPSYRGLSVGVEPVCGYTAAQLRSAYGVTTAASGQGETVAITESEAPAAMAQTLAEYARRNHLPAPRPGQYREVDLPAVTCGGSEERSAGVYDDEAEMDSEAVYAMAPDADQVMVVGSGCSLEQSLLAADVAVLDGDGQHPLASIVSNSWQVPIGVVPASTLHAIDVRAVDEGVGMYYSSGDNPGLSATSADPFVTSVGGTTLGIGADGRRVFETGWSHDTAVLEHGSWDEQGGSDGASGGTSTVHREPAYQVGVVPTSMSQVQVGNGVVARRVVPDIAADADLDSGMLVGHLTTRADGGPGRYVTAVDAGTSLSCPLVAGLIADAQQGQTAAFGFVNPLIYRLAGTSAVHDVLPVTPSTPAHDRAVFTPATTRDPAHVDVLDSQLRRYTTQVTAPGYDTMTGVGTPDGSGFIAGLRRLGQG